MGLTKKERKRRREAMREFELASRKEMADATDAMLELALQSYGVFKQPSPEVRRVLPGGVTLYESGAHDSALIMSTWVVDELESRYPGTKENLLEALRIEFERQGIPVPKEWKGESDGTHTAEPVRDRATD